jgi:hypothetical protein
MKALFTSILYGTLTTLVILTMVVLAAVYVACIIVGIYLGIVGCFLLTNWMQLPSWTELPIITIGGLWGGIISLILLDPIRKFCNNPNTQQLS